MMRELGKERKSTRLKELLKKRGIIVMPGAYDALSAKLVELAGFDAVFLTGHGISVSLLAQSDFGLACFSEIRDRLYSVARAVDIPLFADADTGYGNALNVYRTVKEFIWAGAAALFIEDQIWPKRCGHLPGKQLISKEEMAGKIRAARDARNEEDPDFILAARTDALAVNGLDDAIERSNLYCEAGADVAFIDAIESVEQMQKALKQIKAPLMLNLTEGGKTPLLSVKEAEEMGYKIVIFPLLTCFAAAKAMKDVLAILRETGSAEACRDKEMEFEVFKKISNLDGLRKMEEKYLPEDIIAAKYRSARG